MCSNLLDVQQTSVLNSLGGFAMNVISVTNISFTEAVRFYNLQKQSPQLFFDFWAIDLEKA